MTTQTTPFTQTTTFTRDAITTARDAQQYLTDLKQFLLNRFLAYTQHTQATDDRGRTVEPQHTIRSTDGWSHWTLTNTWLTDLTTSDHITIRHYTADDRGPGTYGPNIHVPTDFIFGDTERDERYAQYLALRAEFDPEA